MFNYIMSKNFDKNVSWMLRKIGITTGILRA